MVGEADTVRSDHAEPVQRRFRMRRRSASSADRYDAFLSYSHAADGALAPSLQRGLEGFAKPWYRRRALRVFRDQTSLAATPALWPDIQDALGKSAYFIVLASPAAATSPWVAREVEFWRQHRPRENLLIVLTEGELPWDTSAEGADRPSALPSALRTAFAEEPLHVDLRWARREQQVSLRHPDFRSAVATLAAQLRHIPKDDLLGEDIVHHRRAIRLAATAVSVLTALAVVASTLGFIAVQRGQEVRAERNVAVQQRNRAEQQARIALSRALAGQAEARFDRNPQLSLLLSAAALRVDVNRETRNSALRQVNLRHGLIGFLQCPTDAGTDLAVSPDGRTLACTGVGTPTLWDLRTRSLLRKPTGGDIFSPAGAVAFHPTGEFLAMASSNVDLWSTRPLSRVGSVGAVRVQAVAFDADGQLLLTAGDLGNVLVWDLATGEVLPQSLDGRSGPVTSLVLRPHSTVAAFGGADGQVHLWDYAAGGKPMPLLDAGSPVTSLAFSSDGQKLAVGTRSGRVLVRDLSRGETRTLPHSEAVLDVAFNPADATLAVGTGNTVVIWETDTGQVAAVIQGSSFIVNSLAYTPDGTSLAFSGGFGGLVTLWDTSTLPTGLLSADGNVKDIAFTTDGRLLAAATGDGGQVDLWDPRIRRRVGELPTGSVEAVAFSPDGETLAAGGPADSTIVYDPFTQPAADTGAAVIVNAGLTIPPEAAAQASTRDKPQLTLWDVPSRAPLETLNTNGSSVLDVAFHPDGRLLTAAHHNGSITVWDVPERRQVRTLQGHTQAVRGLAFTPDGTALASGTGEEVFLWDLRSSTPSARLDTSLTGVDGVAISPDGRTLAAIGREGVELWGLVTKRPLGTLPASAPLDLSFSSDSSTLATAEADASVILWDVRRREQLATLARHIRRVETAAYAPAGDLLATGGQDQTVILWNVGLTDLADHLCALAGRDLSPEERTAYLADDPDLTVCA